VEIFGRPDSQTRKKEADMSIQASLKKGSKLLILFIGFLLIGIIGLIDYRTGYEYAFSLFYVLPISLITWFINQRIGYAASITSAIVWFLADLYSGHPYSQPYILYWNTIIRLAFFFTYHLPLVILKQFTGTRKRIIAYRLPDRCVKFPLFLRSNAG